MMPIQSVGVGATAAQFQSRPPQRGNSPADAVGGLLGISANEIETQLDSGMSLSDIAAAQGISHDDLIEALRDGMPAEMRGAANVEEILESIAAQKGRGPAGGPPPPPPPRSMESTGVFAESITTTQQQVVDSLGDLLEMEPEQVVEELRSGSSLIDLLDRGGLSVSDLADAIDVGMFYDGQI